MRLEDHFMLLRRKTGERMEKEGKHIRESFEASWEGLPKTLKKFAPYSRSPWYIAHFAIGEKMSESVRNHYP